jgi:transposase
MTRFVQSEDRRQGVLLPEYLDDYVAEDNPVRVIDVFIDELDLGALGFDGVIPEATGRPAYHPGGLLKIYVYGYINQIASSRRLERETHRNVELEPDAFRFVHILHLRSSLYIPLRCRFREVGRWLR